MTTVTTRQLKTGRDATEKTQTNKLYLAAWRWHFYAGIYVIPFLLMLSFTGLIMLFGDQIDSVQFREQLFVTEGTQLMSAEAQLLTAQEAFPDATLSEFIPATQPDRSTQISARMEDGRNLTIFVNPYTNEVLGSLDKDTTWYAWANGIHGSFMLGERGDTLIEIAAGLGVMLVITGLYLWLPRDRQKLRQAFLPRLRGKGRKIWRDLHASVGFYASLGLLFFLISGLSWTNVWGGQFVQAWNSFPAEKWGAVSLSADTHADLNHGVLDEVPWALEQTPLPASGSLAGQPGIPADFPVNVDTVMAFARDNGFTGYRVNLPMDAEGVYTISADTMSGDITNATQDRTVHIDQYSGNVLGEVGFADYSLMAKGMAAGIALHQGDMGAWNMIGNLLFISGILFITISGIVMWWLRRPKGMLRLSAPPMPKDMPLWKGAVFIMLLLSLAFPLVGITLLALLAFDLLIISRVPFLKRAFGR